MSYEKIGGSPLDYRVCTYEGSRLNFRGPERALGEPYVAVLGDTATFGKFVARPFSDRLEDKLDAPCINLGVPNAGVDAFAGDLGALSLASKARLTVLQVMNVHQMSNRYYTVHPRRNDRFLSASTSMKALFRGVEFNEYHFVNHMLRHLAECRPDGFFLLMQELRTAWVSRMRLLIDRISSPVVLFWMSDHLPSEKRGFEHIASTPFGVTAPMLEMLRSDVDEIVTFAASPAALARGNEGMIYMPEERQASLQLFGPAVHEEAAEALLPSTSALWERQATLNI